MPAVHIKTNVAYTEEQKTKVLKEITRVMVDVAHKNEEAVMATLLKVDGTMGNTDEPFAFLDIRSMNGIEHKMNNDQDHGGRFGREPPASVSGIHPGARNLLGPDGRHRHLGFQDPPVDCQRRGVQVNTPLPEPRGRG